MELITPVILPERNITLDIDSSVMLLGSCFAEHVGVRLQQRMGESRVDVNPFGVLYNPISIAQAIDILLADDINDATDYIFKGQDGVCHSWLHTGHFSGATEEECKAKITARLTVAREKLQKACLLCITFGTTRCYRLDNGFTVANCHKEPQRCFTEYEPTLDELQALWTTVLQKLWVINPLLKVCFTVSPYRYKKYGFHESQIQKAKLLLLVDSLVSAPDVSYFPAYEIVMDELRDYRFYAADMLHPSDLAVDIIAERFMDWTFTPQLKEESIRNYKRFKQEQHRNIL